MWTSNRKSTLWNKLYQNLRYLCYLGVRVFYLMQLFLNNVHCIVARCSVRRDRSVSRCLLADPASVGALPFLLVAHLGFQPQLHKRSTAIFFLYWHPMRFISSSNTVYSHLLRSLPCLINTSTFKNPVCISEDIDLQWGLHILLVILDTKPKWDAYMKPFRICMEENVSQLCETVHCMTCVCTRRFGRKTILPMVPRRRDTKFFNVVENTIQEGWIILWN
jgi:hypothetical protein